MSQPSSSSPRTVALPLISFFFFAVAFAMRLWGIGWGLPNESRYFSYHVDESLVTTYSLPLNPLLLLLDPGYYNYGSLSLLLNGFVIHLGEWVGWVKPGPVAQVPSASAFLAARLVTVVLGAGTCVLLYQTGRLLFHRTAGIAAALLYAVAPLAVQHGHFATVDVPATFWVTGTLFFCARFLSAEPRKNDLLLAGLFTGLAAATKYNMAMVFLAVVAAGLLAQPRSGKALGFATLSAVGGFLLGCPGVVLNFPAFLKGLLYEAEHVRQGHGLVFVDTLPGIVYHLTFNLPWSLGWPLVLLAIAGVGFALYRRRPGDLMLLAFTLPYYLLISLAVVKFARYLLPILPPLLLWVGSLIPAPENKRAFVPVTISVGLAGVFAFLLAGGFNTVMTQPDPRDRAAAFIRERGFTPVGFATGPWFNAPTLNPWLTAFIPPMAKEKAAENPFPQLIPADGEWNTAQLTATRPAAVALSELNEYADAERVRHPAALEYLTALTAAYPNREVFANPVSFLGIPFTRLSDGANLPAQGLPHDMNYSNPTTIVFYK